ncbi:hypothetical protein HDU81_009111 [Chytriomyces hyalinus]|nr:hypothetical protein HDU81_009111 [Chytriomyces hyalinus]
MSRVAIIGAAGGLGHAIVKHCQDNNIPFTAIVRSRPERIQLTRTTDRVAVVPSLSDKQLLQAAFEDCQSVITATGITSTSNDPSAFLSPNLDTIESAMLAANVTRIVIVNTLVTSAPGEGISNAMRFFKWIPGSMGKGATEMQAVVDALGAGKLLKVKWTLVRAGVHPSGANEEPVASADWAGSMNTLQPVSYEAMARWMVEEASACKFVGMAPLVSKKK